MKFITLISLVGSLQATPKYASDKEPITPEIQEKFWPEFQNELYAMSLAKPLIFVESNNKDGTCMEVGCQGCKDKKILRQASITKDTCQKAKDKSIQKIFDGIKFTFNPGQH
ncbi:hypothetical protein DSO57_1018466 [Entomophthora muscae]|uniref:Uncharacterized protein n=1 Tax=Entomophthora muscae TaxID=34485 RepID=A0ACC2S654_9FUNG|nr:hypothetical protein DSO57_1018466 [Entomophthora muscae]